MEFSRPEYWSGEPFQSPGDISKPEMEPRSLALQEDSLPAQSPGKPKNTGVGSLSLLQHIFPTQGSNPGLPHCRQIFYQLSHKGGPRILEWIAYPFSSISSQPRNRTGVSYWGPAPVDPGNSKGRRLRRSRYDRIKDKKSDQIRIAQ